MGTLNIDGRTATATGKHFYQFYKGREDLFHVITTFLRTGLENKEACLWVVSDALGVLEAVEAFQREYDLMRFIEKGQLAILPAERWFLDRGRFSERAVLLKYQKFIEEKERLRFSAFRVVGDTNWLQSEDWFKFQSFEEKIHEWIRSLRILALCAYPIQHCSMSQTKDILDHHDSVFLSKL